MDVKIWLVLMSTSLLQGMKQSSWISTALSVTEKLQGSVYYMPGLGETQLMFPQAYVKTESGGRMAITMEMM